MKMLSDGGSTPPASTSSEIPTTVPFPASPKTALWWEFLRFPPRLASLDSRRKGNGESREGRKINFPHLLQLRDSHHTVSALRRKLRGGNFFAFRPDLLRRIRGRGGTWDTGCFSGNLRFTAYSKKERQGLPADSSKRTSSSSRKLQRDRTNHPPTKQSGFTTKSGPIEITALCGFNGLKIWRGGGRYPNSFVFIR